MFFPEHPSDAREADHGPSHESGTRARVLQLISSEGPITAAELARTLELTPAAVRRHVDALLEQGAVAEHEAPAQATRGRGRPARAFVVSEVGHRSLEGDYDVLAVDVLRYLTEHVGPHAVADFARDRAAELEVRYAAALDEVGSDPRARATRLVELLTRDGFAASARPVGAGGFSGVQLCQGHCPVQQAAEEFPAFCEAEADVFSRLLGVHVQRLATLAGGNHVCTTFVPTALLRAGPGDPIQAQPPHGGLVTSPPAASPRTTPTTPTDERSFT